ncbi:MAG: nickel pincer cofactor biosynthesis protein LarC [Peptococcaceae bacterium]|nr:nickel pincer cofactor biosynthesis protein LarC [Peptococcaceae bacterium]
MRILYYDCFAGISGDMNLGALLDLGVAPEKLRQSLALLGLGEVFEVRVERGVKGGIEGTRTVVRVTEEAQPLRALADIERSIQGSALPEAVKRKSLDVFRVLAEAEGKIHGCSPDEVHFHEVGAVDALVDIVGGVICLEELGAEELWVSPVELGSGVAVCSHGSLPVPAPAVAELMRGFRVHMGGMPFEATTPTGAALLKGLRGRNCRYGVFTPERVGYGLGMRDDEERANILRVWLGTAEDGDSVGAGAGPDAGSGAVLGAERNDGLDRGPDVDITQKKSFIIETNIDDMNPEWYTFIEEKIFAAGAVDVFRTPILMKKGRGAVQLSVLVPDVSALRLVQDVLLTHTTTLGLRSYAVTKTEIVRQQSVETTSFGPVRVKWVYRGGKSYGKPECEDCHRIAASRGLTLHEVYQVLGQELTTLR